MRLRLFIIPFLISFSATNSFAEDAPELQVEVHGRVSARAKELAKGVVAQIKLAASKKDAPLEDRKTINLYAEGEIATKLSALAQERSRVKISGVLKRDGLQVQTIEEEEVNKSERKEKKEKKKARPPMPPDLDNAPLPEIENKEF